VKVSDFRRIALSLEGAEEGSHMGAPDFRVGGRIFATLASQGQGYGNLMLTPQQQADFVREGLTSSQLPGRYSSSQNLCSCKVRCAHQLSLPG